MRGRVRIRETEEMKGVRGEREEIREDKRKREGEG